MKKRRYICTVRHSDSGWGERRRWGGGRMFVVFNLYPIMIIQFIALIFFVDLLTGSKPLDPNANIGVDPDCLPRPTAGLMAGRSKSPMENSSIDPLSVTSSKSSCTYCDESNL